MESGHMGKKIKELMMTWMKELARLAGTILGKPWMFC